MSPMYLTDPEGRHDVCPGLVHEGHGGDQPRDEVAEARDGQQLAEAPEPRQRARQDQIPEHQGWAKIKS